MSKIAQYLNEHILGEVSTNENVRKQFSTDSGVLSITPELVVFPRITNDIRKVARFTWQLAEKGHKMPMTVRGGGTDQTGASIGSGIIINTTSHLNDILFISPKNNDRFVHVQPGVIFSNLNRALMSHDMVVPATPTSANYATVGGALANNASGSIAGQHGIMRDFVSRLEVVLANGDLIETSRINKKELSKKIGLQSMEGEIYRKLDALIDDNRQLIDEHIAGNGDNVGYSGIANVKHKDGSFDLTPLFVGSQGTLGIVSEIVLRTEPVADEESVLIATFTNAQLAHDTADMIMSFNPSALIVMDGELFKIAEATGKKYPFSDNSDDNISTVLYISFTGQNERTVNKTTKKVLKKLSKLDTTIFTSANYSFEELESIRQVSSVVLCSNEKDFSTPPILNNTSIESLRREEFTVALKEFASKHHLDLPIQIDWVTGIVTIFPKLNLHVISDKQKTFKLINEYTELVARFDGSMAAQSGEGRLKANAIYSKLDIDILNLYKQIRAIFDPYGTLNPGVKQESELKTLVVQLNADYSNSKHSEFNKYY